MRKIVVTLILIAISITGCGNDTSRPADLPPLFPCEITITQEGTPLAGATVALEAFGGTGSVYHPAGITDESGKAVMSTYGFNGVPAGTYKVTVRKTVVEDGAEIIDSYGDPARAPGAEYRAVEQQYSNAATTPHEIEITGERGIARATFDVGRPIRERRL